VASPFAKVDKEPHHDPNVQVPNHELALLVWTEP